jgi:hypothetical protein
MVFAQNQRADRLVSAAKDVYDRAAHTTDASRYTCDENAIVGGIHCWRSIRLLERVCEGEEERDVQKPWACHSPSGTRPKNNVNVAGFVPVAVAGVEA